MFTHIHVRQAEMLLEFRSRMGVSVCPRSHATCSRRVYDVLISCYFIEDVLSSGHCI